MRRQRLGQCSAAFNGRGHLRDDPFQRPILLLLLQDAQTAQERHPHVNQRRQLAGEHRENGRLDFRGWHRNPQLGHFGNGQVFPDPRQNGVACATRVGNNPISLIRLNASR